MRMFLTYLRSCKPGEVAQIFLLGDVFHYWVHRSRKIEGAYGEVLSEARRAAQRGIRIHFFSGNRDFLLGQTLEHNVGEGIEFHEESMMVDLGPRRVYVSHGDELCIDDRLYMLWRKIARAPTLISLFDRLPGSWRDRLVERLSRASREFSNAEPVEVRAAVYRDVFRRGVDTIIHGHLHRRDHIVYEDPPGEVWLLPDWGEGADILVYDQGTDRFELRRVGE
jgi:UDP-2,3-diacylglucosamine hydrolase